jgi:hypothetical protein
MNLETIITIAVGGIIATLAILGIMIAIPKRLKPKVFVTKWKELQAYCRHKDTWHMAIIEADKLLDCALKKRKYKGTSMGERLVSAQRSFSDNDGVWFAHNLAKKLKNEKAVKLAEKDVKEALVCFRQALRDIGALPSGESSKA